MNKEQVYVPLLTPDDCKRFLEIANKAKEPIYEDAEHDFMNGIVDETQKHIHFDGEEWIRELEINLLESHKTQISLDQLSEMLMGKGEIPINTYGMVIENNEIIAVPNSGNWIKLSDHTKQTLELRKELEEKDKRYTGSIQEMAKQCADKIQENSKNLELIVAHKADEIKELKAALYKLYDEVGGDDEYYKLLNPTT